MATLQSSVALLSLNTVHVLSLRSMTPDMTKVHTNLFASLHVLRSIWRVCRATKAQEYGGLMILTTKFILEKGQCRSAYPVFLQEDGIDIEDGP